MQTAQAVTYANKSIPFNWINTAAHAHVGYNTSPYKMNGTIAPGTRCGTAPPVLDDTISDNIPLGFSFNYGGTAFTSVRIMSNGRLQFNNNTACGYGSPVTQLPYVYYRSATDNLDYSMRIYGNDLDPTPQANAGYTTACKLTTTCYMSYASIGTAPNRQFVVTWNNIPEWAAGGSTSGNYNLQVILNEDGTFVYQYGADTPGPQATLAQVGWQVSQIDYDIPNVGLPVNNTAILFYIPSPVAQYHFQQAAWTASGGDVLDTSGSTTVYNGTALGGATPGVGYVCIGADIPSNSNTGKIDAIDTGIPVPTALGGTGTIDFWYKGNRAWSGGGAQDAQLLDATTSNNQWFFVVKRSNGNLRFVITDSNGTLRAAETGANNIPANTWTHIAVTWNFNALAGNNNDRMRIYINGVEAVQSAFTTSGTVSSSIGTLYLGDNRSSFTGSSGTGRSADGALDEVNIYNFEGGTGLIQRDMNYMVTCSGPDHIRVQHDGNGLTCTPATLTVIACANAACTAPNYTTSSVTGNVTWTGTPGGSVPFNITTNGTTTVSLPVTTAQTVTLGTSAVNPAATSPSDCWNTGNATASCSLPFADSGLLVSAPNHVSESLQNMTISAVRKANNALNCVPAFANVSRTVSLTCAYANPTSGTLPVRVAGLSMACPAGATPTLAFNANGTATATLQYADVGQITLNATYTGSAGTGDAGLVMTGSSSFIVAPASFAFSSITGSPIKAGNAFNATVTALNSAANPTPNFGQETTPEGATLSFTKCQPTGASASSGTFSGSLGAFASGAATASNLNWSEVGNGDLTATLASGSYLGSGLSATGNTGTGGTVCNGGGAGNVGRFVPDHFDTSVTGPMACPSGLICPPVGGLVYSGQPFTVNVYAYAKNATGTNTLKNYDGTASTTPNFAKAVTLTAWDALGSTTTQNPPSGSDTLNNSAVPAASFTSGTTTLGTPATPSYTFNTTPTAPTDIYLRAADADATSLRGATSVEGGVKVVSGRIQLSNAHGSELLDLPINATAQYWDGTGYVTSSTDSVSSLSTAAAPAGDVTFANCQPLPPSATPLPYCPPATAPTPVSVVFGSGTAKFTLAKPGANNTGSVDLSIPAVTGASCLVAPTPLGCYLPSNVARATFGVYSSNKNFIYLREQY